MKERKAELRQRAIRRSRVSMNQLIVGQPREKWSCCAAIKAVDGPRRSVSLIPTLGKHTGLPHIIAPKHRSCCGG